MNNSGDLKIEVAENGFIVYEGNEDRALIGKKWAFESSKTLSNFVYEWGVGNTKVNTNEIQSGQN